MRNLCFMIFNLLELMSRYRLMTNAAKITTYFLTSTGLSDHKTMPVFYVYYPAFLYLISTRHTSKHSAILTAPCCKHLNIVEFF